METKYACTDCYVAALDREYPSVYVEHDDVSNTNWYCSHGVPSDNGCVEPDGSGELCSNCEGAGIGWGTTHGGMCDLGQHEMQGYWTMHEYHD